MDFDQVKMLPGKDPVARLQSKVATQAKEIQRLTLQVQALRDDLADIKGQRDKLAREKNDRTR